VGTVIVLGVEVLLGAVVDSRLLIFRLESKLILPIALVAADVRRARAPKDVSLLGRRWQILALFLQEFVEFLCKKLIKLVQLLASLRHRLKRVSLCSLNVYNLTDLQRSCVVFT
jgi:hypothetical protein